MTLVSSNQADRSRKIESTILQALAKTGQTEISKIMGASESTVSRLKEDKIGQFSDLLAAAGLKVVPATYKCIDPAVANAMMLLYESAMKRIDNPASLLWGDE